MKRLVASALTLGCALSLPFLSLPLSGQRTVERLEKGWRFTRVDDPKASAEGYDDSKWSRVVVPHDWAIYGPFSFDNDKQHLAITQDGQKEAMEHAGRTGGLPFVGVGWYRRTLSIPEDLGQRRVVLRFDGAMSHARVYVNGHEAGYWPYGYNSFHLDVTPYVRPGKDNTLAVRLENKHESSRWYPGAGLYRNVHMVITDPIHVPTWGTQIKTPVVRGDFAYVDVETKLAGLKTLGNEVLTIKTHILTPLGTKIAETKASFWDEDSILRSGFEVQNPLLWDIGHPYLYKYVVELSSSGKLLDRDTTTFGIRSIELKAGDGFYLNGRKIKFQGACLHHDLGPLGAAVNEAAMRRQIRLMQDMGVNAIRTSHNMPAPEFVRLCDEMGMPLMAESFDSWAQPKVPNGYNLDFNEWHERDLVNLIHQFRNSPSVIMWSIGNEVPEQPSAEGAKLAYRLQQICHREDPTRPVTNGMDNPKAVLKTGMAATLDIPGFNYRPFLYDTAHRVLPQGFLLGSETCSTVSSRGVYKFPVVRKSMAKYPDHQSSSYDVEHCGWSNLPEDDFMRQEDHSWSMGEFIWTGIDYLGEPTPYYSDWPSHSSLFGAVDLAGIPKDRFYLYRSHWNKTSPTLHILPHWTWPDRVGEVTPIFVYTSYPEAELFINGKSQGRQRKDRSVTIDATENEESFKNFTRQKRYRLMWMDTKYEPGEVKVVAYNDAGEVAEEKVIRTAGKPHYLELVADRTTLTADGRDIAFVTVRVVDKDGNLIPDDARLLNFRVTGAATFRAAASGNPASLDAFHLPRHHTFSGQLVTLVQSSEQSGEAVLHVSAKGLPTATLRLQIK
ncbi:glycoside hydrolase family 2 TIM barrel-domain containing protein [Porphyromonas catoniae]|uniref:Glycoside hydrolase, family 2, sugar binding domain protein n=1 Tax=Porphyromonas catoniae ATCC 51270 TaxID=887901 RepID=Z4WTY1_9PORP|nr:glycoside hydrolase family 2 TIM barrel-domain containing protein [Porphyromonas catoniae]EWC91235.1 glycoside hydrolase, family 2, sugar binding domain protein [Porphyromonas catoniae ATCC 51270]